MQAYLRGDGLFILSAGIKGPLGDGWVNPWMKRSRRRGVLGRKGSDFQRKAEVPETVQRADVKMVDDQAKAVLSTKIPDLEMATHHVEGKQSISAIKELENARLLADQHDPFATSGNNPKSKETPGAPYTEDWLKKNRSDVRPASDIYAEDAQIQISSPSSRSKPPCATERLVSPNAGRDRLQLRVHPLPDSSDGRAETLIKLLRGRKVPGKSTTGHPAQHIVDAETDKQTQSTSYEPERPATPEPTESSSNSHTQGPVNNRTAKQIGSSADVINGQKLPSPPAEISPVRFSALQAESPLAQKSSASIFVSAAYEPEVHTSPPVFSANEIDPVLSKQQEREQGATDAHRMPPPALSTATSSTTVVSALPSAQAAPTAQARLPNESLPSTGDKLSEQTHEHHYREEEINFQFSTQAAIAAAHHQIQQELTTPQAPNDQFITAVTTNPSTMKLKSKSGITLFSAFNKPDQLPSTDDSPNTQKMLNAVTPVDLTTTTKKVPLSIPPEDAESPTLTTYKPVTKRRKRNFRKKASFAPDAASAAGSNSGSSQGSIKASLKVCKHAGDQQTRKNTAKAEHRDVAASAESPGAEASEFGKLGLDMETSVEHEVDEPQLAPPATEEEVTAVKDSFSVSKPTTTNQTSARTTTTSESARQDAQRVGPAGMAISTLIPLQQSNNGLNNARDKESVTDGASRDGEGEGEGAGQENFDLSAAMDEVGSFLQSWDTEREVREIKRSQDITKSKSRTRPAERETGTGMATATATATATPDLRTSLRELRHRSRR